MLAMPSRTIPTESIKNKKPSSLSIAGLCRIISEAKDAFLGTLFVFQILDHFLQFLDLFTHQFDLFFQVIIAGERKYASCS